MQPLELEIGKKFVPPLLEPALLRLEQGFEKFKNDSQFKNELTSLLNTFAGRPTALTFAKQLSAELGCRIYLKREDLVHGGAHKLNNALAQCLLAKYMGFTEVIAETGAGQHGVATAMAGAKLGLKVTVFQGAKDVERQKLNALRMKLFGAELVPVSDGSATLKEAVNAAMRFWVAHSQRVAYCLGSIVGPHPYPFMVRTFQSVIGDEARLQIMALAGELPHSVYACVGGGSNAAGLFSAFADINTIRLVACEAAGAASLSHGSMGTLHGMETLLLQTPERQIASTHSVSAGLDYPGVGPWLAALKLSGRLKALALSDDLALAALTRLAQKEGILCALETAHALAGVFSEAENIKGKTVLVGLSGRGDKDLETLIKRGLLV